MDNAEDIIVSEVFRDQYNPLPDGEFQVQVFNPTVYIRHEVVSMQIKSKDVKIIGSSRVRAEIHPSIGL